MADPLSSVQQILQRTNTSPAVQKLRLQNIEPATAHIPASPTEANADKKHSGEAPRETAAGSKSDRK